MKVLHVIPSVSEKHGGPTYAVYAFARAALGNGIHVVVATTDDDGGRRRLQVPLGEPVERRGIQHIFFRRDTLPYKISFSLAKWLGQNARNFDLVHIHALFSFSSYAAARAARKRGVPYIVRPLGVLSRWGIENRRRLAKQLSLRFVELPILRGAAVVHFTAEAERAEAVDLRPDISSCPSFTLPIPVEAPPEIPGPREFLDAFPGAAGKKLILFLSRLDPKKGLEPLLDSFRVVKSAEPDAMLVLAGEGKASYVQSLNARADELNVQPDILWTGHLHGRQKAAALAAASLFVLPSYSENFGIAAAEALAAGLPTIVSDQVAISKELSQYDAGLVVPPEPLKLAT
jgi:glycosyltransferase involved in cell wall biosynthesis